MKKLLVILIILGIMISNTKERETREEQRGVFISYIEIKELLENKSSTNQKKEIIKILNNIKEIKGNMIILQVRANQDSLYQSKIFPSMVTSQEDLLTIFLEEAHQRKIKVIAWINPYRISTTNKEIKKDSPVYKYIDTDIIYKGNGIFLNPAKEEAEELVLKGVEEIMEYPIDGLLMDDYFYPSDDIDKIEYEEYTRKEKPISLQEYHFKIINQMIKKTHNLCQKKKIKFGISPDGNIENNMNQHYADVKTWMKENGYIDFIMPQLYYGFYNSTQAYTKVLKEWEELLENEEIEFYVALAFYKVGIEDKYAKEGRKEWLENDNIMMREILLSRNSKNYQGFALFRYNNVFNTNQYTSNSLQELENMKKIIK